MKHVCRNDMYTFFFLAGKFIGEVYSPNCVMDMVPNVF